MSAVTEFQCLLSLRKWKNLLNEGLELAIIDDLHNVGESPAVGLDPYHRGANALFSGEVLPRLLRQRYENPAFLEDFERSPLRISANGVEHHVHVADVIFKASHLVVDRF